MVAARAINLQIEFFKASTRQEIDVIFASFVRERPDALFVSTDTFFSSRRAQLVNLASRHGIPTGFPNREAAEIGGLMSYGSNIPNVWRQAGAYAGRILEGAKPVDLPVVQSSNFELVINAIGRLVREPLGRPEPRPRNKIVLWAATPPRIPENRDLCDALDDSSGKKEGALELRASRHCQTEHRPARRAGSVTKYPLP